MLRSLSLCLLANSIISLWTVDLCSLTRRSIFQAISRAAKDLIWLNTESYFTCVYIDFLRHPTSFFTVRRSLRQIWMEASVHLAVHLLECVCPHFCIMKDGLDTCIWYKLFLKGGLNVGRKQCNIKKIKYVAKQ